MWIKSLLSLFFFFIRAWSYIVNVYMYWPLIIEMNEDVRLLCWKFLNTPPTLSNIQFDFSYPRFSLSTIYIWSRFCIYEFPCSPPRMYFYNADTARRHICLNDKRVNGRLELWRGNLLIIAWALYYSGRCVQKMKTHQIRHYGLIQIVARAELMCYYF